MVQADPASGSRLEAREMLSFSLLKWENQEGDNSGDICAANRSFDPAGWLAYGHERAEVQRFPLILVRGTLLALYKYEDLKGDFLLHDMTTPIDQ